MQPALCVLVSCAIGAERQIASDGTTWLDRELVADKPTPLAEAGFGRDVKDALYRRAERLVEMGVATDDGKSISVPFKSIAHSYWAVSRNTHR